MDPQLSGSEQWLTEEDSKCFGGRLERLEWMVDRTPRANAWWFYGGLHSKMLFEEMRYCFVYGQYLASVLVGFSFLETTLAALLFGSGRNDLRRASLQRLIQESVGDGWITSEESRDMNRLRDIRNPYAHFRPPLDETSIEVSALSRGSSPYEIAESDAAAVILVALGILDKTADHHSLNR